MFCRYCGSHIADDSLFCAKCGKRLGVRENPRVARIVAAICDSLEGEPPYTVFIGNAKNVKVFYGGRPVDFSAHVNGQNDTARFTVP